jgi:anaerobic ribonucleoside-triphosphate reductase activating protein
MNYATIKYPDIANGPGVRVSLFVSGCRRACKGCFNKEAWDFKYGQEFTYETLSELGRLLEKPEIQGLSILGGDPFEPENRDGVAEIIEFVRVFYPSKDIWVWTGFLWEDIKDLEVVKYIDILVDGPFVEELKDLRLKFRGSSNQRIIDVRESLIEEDVVEWD